MDLITVDFETYYGSKYSLKKLTTEEYIRSDEFEVIGVSVKVNDEEAEWASGSHKQLKAYLQGFDWDNSMLLAHNTMFDGAILSWIFDIHPKVLADTLCMARALHGVEVGGSLKVLATRYGIGAKGTEIGDALGLHRTDFGDEQLSAYGDYCINDTELCYELFHIMGDGFPKSELKIIDTTLRMFTEPLLELDMALLNGHLKAIKGRKAAMLEDCWVHKDDLMSNPKFAQLLIAAGATPPMKTSPTTKKETYAFAKSDKEFMALLQHSNPAVQALVSARLGNKSTLEETRTQRFIDIAGRGALPVPIKYYAAHTGRFGGDDSINLQNLPSRGEDAKQLKRSIKAPEGYMVVDCDSSQIEARVLAWLAEQEDLVTAFTNGEDVYKQMASKIYAIPEEQVTKEQRFVGKSTILGAGYGMGAVRFKEQLRIFGVEVKLDEARRIIEVYRDTNWKVCHLWRNAQNALEDMFNGKAFSFGRDKLLRNVPSKIGAEIKNCGFTLPSGLILRYEDMVCEQTHKGPQFSYMTRSGRTKIYGGKVIENLCQALARIIIAEQMVKVARKYRTVLTVHDSIGALVPVDEVVEGQMFIEKCMRRIPTWAEGLPLECESGFADNYGDAG